MCIEENKKKLLDFLSSYFTSRHVWCVCSTRQAWYIHILDAFYFCCRCLIVFLHLFRCEFNTMSVWLVLGHTESEAESEWFMWYNLNGICVCASACILCTRRQEAKPGVTMCATTINSIRFSQILCEFALIRLDSPLTIVSRTRLLCLPSVARSNLSNKYVSNVCIYMYIFSFCAANCR